MYPLRRLCSIVISIMEPFPSSSYSPEASSGMVLIVLVVWLRASGVFSWRECRAGVVWANATADSSNGAMMRVFILFTESNPDFRLQLPGQSLRPVIFGFGPDVQLFQNLARQPCKRKLMQLVLRKPLAFGPASGQSFLLP